MAYDEHLAGRISQLLKHKHVAFEEKKMFGGISFMVNDKMCAGILQGSMVARIDPALHTAALKKKGCHVMVFGGRTMKGLLGIDPEAVDLEKDLDYWISLALEYNPIVKAKKKS